MGETLYAVPFADVDGDGLWSVEGVMLFRERYEADLACNPAIGGAGAGVFECEVPAPPAPPAPEPCALGPRIYVSGPVSGVGGDNRAAFDAARRALLEAYPRAAVEVPHDHVPEGTPWASAMRLCLSRLALADMAVRLPGSSSSLGSALEMELCGHARHPRAELSEAVGER